MGLSELLLQEWPWATAATLIAILLLQWRQRSSNKKILAETEKLNAETIKIRKDTESAAFELTNNHGSSTKDAIDRTEALVKSIAGAQQLILSDLLITREELQGVKGQLERLDGSHTTHLKNSRVWVRKVEQQLTPLSTTSVNSPPHKLD